VARSKTGHFSFWLGKYHVVGVSGEAARKGFLEHADLERVAAAVLHGVGPEIVPPIHPIFRSVPKGHSYFQRRVLDFVKTDHLAKNLPKVTKDSRTVFEALAKSPKGFVNPVDACYRLVLKQSCRILCTDQISDTPSLMDTYLGWTSMLQHVSSGHTVCMPWLPSWSHMKRQYCRRGLNNLVAPIVANRMKEGAARQDDTLQTLIDDGDSQDYIVTFFISILFISVANAGKLAGVLLTMMANHANWQDKIYGEVKAAAAAHSKNKEAPLVDQLDSLPLEAWEESFTFLELCFREAIRMHVAFPMIRVNESRQPILIPGTKEIIPPGSFVAYNTGDAHFSEKLYPNPGRLDPSRFSEGRNEYKKESYACEYSKSNYSITTTD
jgi:cytochrome P450